MHRFTKFTFILLGAVVTGLLGGCASQSGHDKAGDIAPGEHAQKTPTVKEGGDQARLTAALNTIYEGFDTEGRLRYFSRFTDLNGNGKRDAVAFVVGADQCVNGCDFYVFKRQGNRFEAVSRVPTARAPVFALDTRHAGWHDLLLSGGETNGDSNYQRLRFANGSYIPVAVKESGDDSVEQQPLIKSLDGQGHALNPKKAAHE